LIQSSSYVRRRGITVGYPCVLFLAALVVAGRSAGAEPTKPLRIGVLDTAAVYDRYERVAGLDRQLQADIARYEELIQAHRQSVDALERAQRSPRGTRPSAQAVAQAQAALRETRRNAAEELRVLEAHATATVEADVRSAAATVARQYELDLVLDRTDVSLLMVRTTGDLVVDVTDAVIRELNTNRYEP